MNDHLHAIAVILVILTFNWVPAAAMIGLTAFSVAKRYPILVAFPSLVYSGIVIVVIAIWTSNQLAFDILPRQSNRVLTIIAIGAALLALFALPQKEPGPNGTARLVCLFAALSAASSSMFVPDSPIFLIMPGGPPHFHIIVSLFAFAFFAIVGYVTFRHLSRLHGVRMT
jgi:hypothetical protein